MTTFHNTVNLLRLKTAEKTKRGKERQTVYKSRYDGRM
jgi:hypothetical protein